MASELGYITAAVLRKESNDVDANDFSDSDLDGMITKSEHFVHVAKKRSTASPWTTAEDEYEIVQRVVLHDARAQVFGAIDGMRDAKKEAETSRDFYLDLLLNSEVGKRGTIEKSQGINNGATDSDPGTFA